MPLRYFPSPYFTLGFWGYVWFATRITLRGERRWVWMSFHSFYLSSQHCGLFYTREWRSVKDIEQKWPWLAGIWCLLFGCCQSGFLLQVPSCLMFQRFNTEIESLELWDHKWKAADRLKVFPHIFTGISTHTCSQGPLPCNGTPHVLASVPVLAVGMYKRTTCLSPLLSQDNLYFHNSRGWYWRLRGKKTKTNPWTLRSFVTTGTNTSHRGRTRASFLTISLDYFVLSAA